MQLFDGFPSFILGSFQAIFSLFDIFSSCLIFIPFEVVSSAFLLIPYLRVEFRSFGFILSLKVNTSIRNLRPFFLEVADRSIIPICRVVIFIFSW